MYVGGNFNAVGSVQRGQLASFDAANGALLDWAPQAAGGKVWAIVLNPTGTKLAVARLAHGRQVLGEELEDLGIGVALDGCDMLAASQDDMECGRLTIVRLDTA